ncbi:LysR family transcriptional regulator [Nocardia australiensis]|uniref:LysR family transcriptional regulator n=1 Tax=Nocardia australiensis TaxID=2887191 RepID=UPI001D15334F|nr:LysR family transcriptional regulator [Nocardia australiensis]
MEFKLDLNLLLTLDALLDERSVGGAARRLHTSPPAMSRTLAKLRRILNDPILVRAGRTMVPTPRALTMQGRVRDLVEQAHTLFAPLEQPDPASLRRTFSVQIGDLMFSGIGYRLLHRMHAEAPGVTVRFVAESHEDTHSLRDGSVDVELGRIRRGEPETHIEPLLRERLVGVVREGHDLLTEPVTPPRYAAAEHVVFSRRGIATGPIDDLLAEYGLTRRILACAPNPAGALFLLPGSELVGAVPARLGRDGIERLGLRTFEIPLPLPVVDLGMAWHPRHDADGAHQWLRAHVRAAVLDGAVD